MMPSMKIVRDNLLHTTPDDLGVKVIEGDLHAPPELVRLLNKVGVRDGAYLIPMIEDMPTLFISELGIQRSQLDSIHASLEKQLGELTKRVRVPFDMPPLGAMPSKLKRP